jgi:hypothetical protein
MGYTSKYARLANSKINLLPLSVGEREWGSTKLSSSLTSTIRIHINFFMFAGQAAWASLS